MSILQHSDILALRDAALAAGLADGREALLAGLDQRFIATLRTHASPGCQVLLDLQDLNAAGILLNGVVPLMIWLTNAVALSAPRREAIVFERALADCNAVSADITPSSPHTSLPRTPSDTPQSPHLVIDDVIVTQGDRVVSLDVRVRNTGVAVVNLTRANLRVLRRVRPPPTLSAYVPSAEYDLLLIGRENEIAIAHVLRAHEVDAFLLRVGVGPDNKSCAFTCELELTYNGTLRTTSNSFSFNTDWDSGSYHEKQAEKQKSLRRGHNQACSKLAQSLSGGALLKCPHCHVVSSSFRHVHRDDNQFDFFVCKHCWRSVQYPDLAPALEVPDSS